MGKNALSPSSPRAEEQGRGRRRPDSGALGHSGVRERGERKRGAREVDPRPQLGRRRPGVVWPRRRVEAGGGCFRPASRSRGGGQGEGLLGARRRPPSRLGERWGAPTAYLFI